MENEAPKLVATCPVCNKAYFADGKSKLIARRRRVRRRASSCRRWCSMGKLTSIERKVATLDTRRGGSGKHEKIFSE